jgi:hypothetical protein
MTQQNGNIPVIGIQAESSYISIYRSDHQPSDSSFHVVQIPACMVPDDQRRTFITGKEAEAKHILKNLHLYSFSPEHLIGEEVETGLVQLHDMQMSRYAAAMRLFFHAAQGVLQQSTQRYTSLGISHPGTLPANPCASIWESDHRLPVPFLVPPSLAFVHGALAQGILSSRTLTSGFLLVRPTEWETRLTLFNGTKDIVQEEFVKNLALGSLQDECTKKVQAKLDLAGWREEILPPKVSRQVQLELPRQIRKLIQFSFPECLPTDPRLNFTESITLSSGNLLDLVREARSQIEKFVSSLIDRINEQDVFTIIAIPEGWENLALMLNTTQKKPIAVIPRSSCEAVGAAICSRLESSKVAAMPAVIELMEPVPSVVAAAQQSPPEPVVLPAKPVKVASFRDKNYPCASDQWPRSIPPPISDPYAAVSPDPTPYPTDSRNKPKSQGKSPRKGKKAANGTAEADRNRWEQEIESLKTKNDLLQINYSKVLQQNSALEDNLRKLENQLSEEKKINEDLGKKSSALILKSKELQRQLSDAQQEIISLKIERPALTADKWQPPVSQSVFEASNPALKVMQPAVGATLDITPMPPDHNKSIALKTGLIIGGIIAVASLIILLILVLW